MEKHRAIPEGYITIGEIAKKMGVTVRTLQHYDKEGVFSPSAQSEGGRRLYTDKDIVKLHRILSFKQLGFSLPDIKGRLSSLETPAEISAALNEQADVLRKNIEGLTHSLREIELLEKEVQEMQTVDFKKYAAILINLKMQNEFYYLVKHMDEQMLEHMQGKFTVETATAFMQAQNNLFDKIEACQNEGYAPSSEQVQALAKEFWDMITYFTDGDMSMLPKLIEIANVDIKDSNWEKKQAMMDRFLNPALDIYFTNLGVDPLEEGQK